MFLALPCLNSIRNSGIEKNKLKKKDAFFNVKEKEEGEEEEEQNAPKDPQVAGIRSQKQSRCYSMAIAMAITEAQAEARTRYTLLAFSHLNSVSSRAQ